MSSTYVFKNDSFVNDLSGVLFSTSRNQVPSFKDISTNHRLILSPVPNNYSSRAHEELLLSGYKPTNYSPNPATAKDVGLVPTADELLQLINERFTSSAEGVVQFDEKLRPCNPIGPTGLYGKGRLWRWGPNHAADALIVYRDTNGDYKFLSIKRPCGTWAIPGGFIDKGENSRKAAIRELGEEALESSDELTDRFNFHAKPIYRGYADDPRNTDNAWIETTVYLLEIDQELASQLVRKATEETSGEVKEIRWISFNDEIAKQLYSNHSDYIELAKSRLLIASADRSYYREQRATVIEAPAVVSPCIDLPHIFLAGSIEMGASRNWQQIVIDELNDLPVVILNPRRANFTIPDDSVAADVLMREQIRWELLALERADHIILNCESNTLSPITLLEFGLYARSGKLSICCSDTFWRKTNLQVTSERYGIPYFSRIEDLISSTKGVVKEFYSNRLR